MPVFFKTLTLGALRWTARAAVREIARYPPSLPIIRDTRIRASRGGGPFHFSSNVTVVGPAQLTDGGRRRPIDHECVEEIQKLLESYGLYKDQHYHVRYVHTDEALADEDLERDLIVVGGPYYNGLTKELLEEHDILEDVEYHPGATADSRRFAWRNTLFRGGEGVDYGLLAVAPNPFHDERRVVLCFGLRELGTLAAGTAFAAPKYDTWRSEVESRHYRECGRMEIVVRALPRRGGLGRASLAKPAHGIPLDGSGGREWFTADAHALSRLYDSLDQHPVPVELRDCVFGMTVRSNYAVELTDEGTWAGAGGDWFVRGKLFGCTTAPLGRIDDLRVRAEPIENLDDVVTLPAESTPSRKRFLVFPIPPYRVGGPRPRIRITGEWPNAAEALNQVGVDDEYTFGIPDNVDGVVDSVTITIRFQTPAEHEYRVRSNTPDEDPGHRVRRVCGTETLEYSYTDVAAGSVFRYRIRRVR